MQVVIHVEPYFDIYRKNYFFAIVWNRALLERYIVSLNYLKIRIFVK